MNLKQYEYEVVVNGGRCMRCNSLLTIGSIRTHDNESGIQLADYEKKQWPYFVCAKCGYGTSFWKITGRRDNTVPKILDFVGVEAKI